eukprot:4167247-Alexandrium_andersonii.AAC.1
MLEPALAGRPEHSAGCQQLGCVGPETHWGALAAAEWAAALPCQKALASVAAAAGPKKPGG